MLKNKFSQKTVILTLLAFPVIVVILFFITQYRPAINLLENDLFSFHAFTDSTDHPATGKSECILQSNKQQITVFTDLNKGYEFPYAGIILHPKNNKLFDLRNYILDFDVKTNDNFRLPIRLTLYIPGFTNSTQSTSYLFLIETLPINRGTNNYHIAIADFKSIPQWWFTENNISEKEIKEYNYKYTQAIAFFSDPSYPVDRNIEYTITNFHLRFHWQPFLLWSVIFLIAYYIVIILLWKFSTLKNKLVIIPIEPTEIKQNSSNHLNTLLTYIGQNYANAELKIKDVATHVGITENSISEILKNYCKMGFKQYLNQVRLEEAKRLLKNSDLQISEIAFKVGYNNVSHFNRTFKEIEGISPTQFKEK